MKADTKLWEDYKLRLLRNRIVHGNLDQQYDDYCHQVLEISIAHEKFRSILKDLPLGVALRAWMVSTLDEKVSKELVEKVLSIIDGKALPLQQKKKEVFTLGYLQELGLEAHKQILEEIRCNGEWSVDKKEELVKCYIHFSEYLNEATKGEILLALDPDRAATAHKLLDFDTFIQFVQSVAERDALIAKLLYFGAPSVEDVVLLRYGMLKKANSAVNFTNLTVKYPKHLIQDILSYAGKKGKDDLVFLNYRGNNVERTHLSQSFANISSKIFDDRKITPRTLLETKTELS
jgi:hypothetical protein